jgi:Helix-turn-helix domain
MPRKDCNLKLKSPEITAAFADPHWALEYPPVLSVEQAAALVQVPSNTIYDWSSRGLLRGCSRRVGKYLRIFRDRFIERVFNEGLTSQ